MSTTARLLVIHAVTVSLLVAADSAIGRVFPFYRTPEDSSELAMYVCPFVAAAALLLSPWPRVGFALGAVASLILGLPLLAMAPLSIFAGVAHGKPPEGWYWAPITTMGLLVAVATNFALSTRGFIRASQARGRAASDARGLSS